MFKRIIISFEIGVGVENVAIDNGDCMSSDSDLVDRIPTAFLGVFVRILQED